MDISNWKNMKLFLILLILIKEVIHLFHKLLFYRLIHYRFDFM